MANDPYLVEEYINTGQKSADVACNDFLFALAAHAHLTVISQTNTPGTLTEGNRYLAGTAPTGVWSTFANQIIIAHGGAWKNYVPQEGWTVWVADVNKRLRSNGTLWIDEVQTKTLTVLNPTTADNITVAYFKRATTIRRVNAVVRGTGTPSTTFQLVQGLDRSAAGTNVFSAGQVITNTTVGQELITFADATMPIGSFLWFTCSAVTTTTQIHLTIEVSED